MTIIMFTIDSILGTYTGLKFNQLVPCNCSVCQQSNAPHFYLAKTLRKFLVDYQQFIQCQLSYEMVSVRGLVDDLSMDGVSLDSTLRETPGLTVHGPVATLVYQPTSQGRITMRHTPAPQPHTAWRNGSFYIFLFAVVLSALGISARYLPTYVLPIILVAALLFVPIIGALQLRQDKKLSEQSFLALMKLAITQLPLIGQRADTEKRAQDE